MNDDAEFLTPVTGGRASQQIVAQIVGLLRSGKLDAGDRLPPERQLAEDFGVSRVTVRDALRVLEAQGLMTVKVGASGGAFVTAPSVALVGDRLHDLLALSSVTPEEVAEARYVMELGIVSLAVERATAEDLAALDALCEAAEQALVEGRYGSQLASDFHARLAASAHNGAVTKIAESFRGPLRMATLRAREDTDAAHRRTVADHRALVMALSRRDAAEAAAVMGRHLTRGTELDIPTVPIFPGRRAMQRTRMSERGPDQRPTPSIDPDNDGPPAP